MRVRGRSIREGPPDDNPILTAPSIHRFIDVVKVTKELTQKTEHYRAALGEFTERLEEDRHILAAVLLGSLHETLIWDRHEIHLWIVEADGVTKRLAADGKSERLFRTLVANDVNIRAELIPRSRFKLMVEGASRTAFSCNFFEKRQLVYSQDASIEQWFEQANQVATRDQEKERLAVAAWLTHARRHALDCLGYRKSPTLAVQSILWCAHAIACLEIIAAGEVYEDVIIDKAVADRPELFGPIYTDLLARKPTKPLVETGLNQIEQYLESHRTALFKPIVDYLRKNARVTPLSEMCDHFAYTQLYPWHLETACEYLRDCGTLEKVATPFHLTKRSLVEVEEPAYFLDA